MAAFDFLLLGCFFLPGTLQVVWQDNIDPDSMTYEVCSYFHYLLPSILEF